MLFDFLQTPISSSSSSPNLNQIASDLIIQFNHTQLVLDLLLIYWSTCTITHISTFHLAWLCFCGSSAHFGCDCWVTIYFAFDRGSVRIFRLIFAFDLLIPTWCSHLLEDNRRRRYIIVQMVRTWRTNDTSHPVVEWQGKRSVSSSSSFVGSCSIKPFWVVVGRTVIYAGMILISSSFLDWLLDCWTCSLVTTARVAQGSRWCLVVWSGTVCSSLPFSRLVYTVIYVYVYVTSYGISMWWRLTPYAQNGG